MKLIRHLCFSMLIFGIACKNVPDCQRVELVDDYALSLGFIGARCSDFNSTPEIVNNVMICKCNDKK